LPNNQEYNLGEIVERIGNSHVVEFVLILRRAFLLVVAPVGNDREDTNSREEVDEEREEGYGQAHLRRLKDKIHRQSCTKKARSAI